jgi:hypothetical protein
MQTGKRKKLKDLVPENSSGTGKPGTVPDGLPRWNWGAFLLGWIWAIGNNKFDIAVYGLVIFCLSFLLGPLGWLANFCLSIVFGVKGNEWAWQNKEWQSVEHFKKAQKTWAKWGILALTAYVILMIYAGAIGFGLWRI